MKLWVGPIVVSRRLVVDTAAAHSNFRSKQSRVWRVETLQTNVSHSFNPNGQFTGHRKIKIGGGYEVVAGVIVVSSSTLLLLIPIFGLNKVEFGELKLCKQKCLPVSTRADNLPVID